MNTKPVAWTVIAKGETNAVFRVSLDNGSDVIARQHFSKSGKWFENETKALQTLRAAGIPVAEVLATHEQVVDDGVFSLSLQTLVPGTPYSETYRSLTPAQHRQVLNETGQLIRRLHRVAPGPSLRRVGVARSRAQYSRMARRLKGSQWPMSKPDLQVLNGALTVIKAFWPDAKSEDFVHGEVHPKHVMVEHGHVTGLVDLEFAGRGDAAIDQACWNFWRFDSQSAKPLYGALRVPSSQEFAHRAAVYELMIGLAALDHYVAHNDWSAATSGLRRLESTMKRHSSKHFGPIDVADSPGPSQLSR